MKTSSLIGVQLDYWVAKAEGYRMIRVGYEGCADETDEQKDLPDWFWKAIDHSVGCYWMRESDQFVVDAADPSGQYETPWGTPFSPSASWAAGGPIIEREMINLTAVRGAGWMAKCGRIRAAGETALIAAMRAFVTERIGDEVAEIP